MKENQKELETIDSKVMDRWMKESMEKDITHYHSSASASYIRIT